MANSINVLDRAMEIVELLYENKKPMGISEISRELGEYKSTVHRTLLTLKNKGYIVQNPENEKYWLGLKFYAIGMVVGEKMDIIDIVRPYAKQLNQEFNEVVNVSMLETHEEGWPKSIVVYKEVTENNLLTVQPSIGSSSVCYCSSVGKCLLAFAKDVDCEKLKTLPIHTFTNKTIKSWDELARQLQETRIHGYAVDHEEQECGLTCIGAPILDRDGFAIAAISLSGPTRRMEDGNLEMKIRRVEETAREISSHIKEF